MNWSFLDLIFVWMTLSEAISLVPSHRIWFSVNKKKSHLENRKNHPVSIPMSRNHMKSYESKKNFPKTSSHKKAVKIFFLFSFDSDQRYCLCW